MVDEIFSGLGALISGAGGGVLGSFASRLAGYFEKKQEMKRLELEHAQELALLDRQIKERSHEREHEASIAAGEQFTQRLVGSYEHDSSYGHGYLRWVRPSLTFLLLVFTGVYAFTAATESLQGQIITAMVGYSGIALGWWFADHSIKHSRG